MKKSQIEQKKIPLYKQIFQILKKEIEENKFTPGDEYFSEKELLERFSVSRTTIREALRSLEVEGYIYRSQGANSIVASNKSIIWDLMDITVDLRTKEKHLKNEIISVTKESPSDEVRSALQLTSPDDFVYRIERIRKVNNLKLTRSISHIVSWLDIDFTNIQLESTSSIYTILDEYNKKPQTCDEIISVINGDKKTCEMLDLETNTGLFYREKISYDRKKRPVEFVMSYYNGKYAKYHISNKII